MIRLTGADAEELGVLFKNERLARGITQHEAGQLLKLNESSVCNVEAGRRLDMLLKSLRFFDGYGYDILLRKR